MNCTPTFVAPQEPCAPSADGAGSASDSVLDMRLETLEQIFLLLAAYYGMPVLEPDNDPLGGLIETVLSQSTSDVNSQRAYQDLRAALPTWEAVVAAPEARVAEAIRHGGLANIKAARIQAVLRAVTAQLPEAADGATLDERFTRWLGSMPVAAARAALRALPGVGPKTAACVLLFSLGLPSMPVDTHVYRVSQRLGVIGPKTSVARTHEQYDAILPDAMVYPLHVLFIRHGRTLCRAQRPRCDRCPLLALCPWGQQETHT
jgi:endonuclease-3